MTKDVQYFAPATLEEALHLLGENGSHISVMAGGTDLVRDMNLEFKIPDGIMWIGRMGMEYIESKKDAIHIGAATRMLTAASTKVIEEKATALARAARKIASPPIRTLATVGGNLCNASPGADTACALLGLGAEVVLTSAKGQRTVPLREFFTGPNQTVLQPGEMLTEIVVQPTGKNEGSAFYKQGRRAAMTLAVVNAAARVKLDGKGNCESVSIAVGAAAPTPIRAVEAENVLGGQPFTEGAIREAAEVASTEISPIDDVHGTAWYRRKVAKVLVARALREAGGLNGGAN